MGQSGFQVRCKAHLSRKLEKEYSCQMKCYRLTPLSRKETGRGQEMSLSIKACQTNSTFWHSWSLRIPLQKIITFEWNASTNIKS